MISQLHSRFHVKPRLMLGDCPPMAVLRLWVLPTGCGVGTFIPAITLLFYACAVGILPHNRATKTKPDQMFNINRSFWQVNIFVICDKRDPTIVQELFLNPPLTIIGAYVEIVDSECWKSWLDETNWSPRVEPWFRSFFPYGALSRQHLHRSSNVHIYEKFLKYRHHLLNLFNFSAIPLPVSFQQAIYFTINN